MNATLTLVVCLAATPERCEVHDVKVDAQTCFYGGPNVADTHTPAGWVLKSARCVPAQKPNGPPDPRSDPPPTTG